MLFDFYFFVLFRKTIGDDFVSIRSHLKKGRIQLGEPPFIQEKIQKWEILLQK